MRLLSKLQELARETKLNLRFVQILESGLCRSLSLEIVTVNKLIYKLHYVHNAQESYNDSYVFRRIHLTYNDTIINLYYCETKPNYCQAFYIIIIPYIIFIIYKLHNANIYKLRWYLMNLNSSNTVSHNLKG